MKVVIPTLSRRERIVMLLDHYADYFLLDRNGHRGDPDGPGPMLPKMSREPSVLELCRCLHDLQVFAPREHAHLKAFFTAEWRIARSPRKPPAEVAAVYVAARGGKPAHYAYRERVVPAWVDTHHVWRAVSWIAWKEGDPDQGPSAAIRFRHEPSIPTELLEEVA